MNDINRRTLLIGSAGAAGLLGLGGLAAWSKSGSGSASTVGVSSEAVRRAEDMRRKANQSVVNARLIAQPITLNLGGLVVQTWGYGESLPGPLLRAQAGDLLRVKVDNKLGTDTSVHWHGIALRNDMDGVPGVTQEPIASGKGFTYVFTAPDPGTYFYHPHSGVQLDRGLYGALVIDDPIEPGKYDEEWIVVLDDWVDGTGRNPDQILKKLRAAKGSDQGSMGGMDMGSMGASMQSPLLGGAGDIDYPHYLINGRTPGSPATLTAKPGQRVRIRIINAGSDTAFRLALGGHPMTVTHSDGFPVEPLSTDALLIGMGERYDVVVTLRDGAFPLVASAEGKKGQGMAVVRTGAGRRPGPDVQPAELNRRVVLSTDMTAAAQALLPKKTVDRQHNLAMSGSMAPYQWGINGKMFPDTEPLMVKQGERVGLRFQNRSMMFHPMHVHGHTFALASGGARKDTVIVRPMQTVDVELEANNPGRWATHCHNIYHAESGMMTTLSYEG